MYTIKRMDRESGITCGCVIRTSVLSGLVMEYLIGGRNEITPTLTDLQPCLYEYWSTSTKAPTTDSLCHLNPQIHSESHGGKELSKYVSQTTGNLGCLVSRLYKAGDVALHSNVTFIPDGQESLDAVICVGNKYNNNCGQLSSCSIPSVRS